MNASDLKKFLIDFDMPAAACARMCSKDPNTFSRYLNETYPIPEDVVTTLTGYTFAANFVRYLHAKAYPMRITSTLRHTGRSTAKPVNKINN